MGLLIALAAVVSFTAGASAQCVPLADAAVAAGLTSLVDTVGVIADLEPAAPLIDLVTTNETIDTPITVFAPTNAAFAEIASTVAILEDELVLAVLLNHVLAGAFDSETILAATPGSFETVLGTTLTTSLSGSELIVSSGLIDATVVVTDVETCAGIVHVIDKVLVPAITEPSVGPMPVMPAPSPMAVAAEPMGYGDVAGVYGDVGAY